LSDPGRRAEYDSLFRSRPASDFTDDKSTAFDQEQASGSFFQNFSSFFQNATGAGAAAGAAGAGAAHPRPDANGVFGDVFEEMCVSYMLAAKILPPVGFIFSMGTFV